MAPPLIGLTSTHIERNGRIYDSVSTQYSRAIIQAGGLPILIPLATLEVGFEDMLRQTYERLDGLLLPGGGDIHPEFYGEVMSDMVGNVLRMRDKTEILLAQWAYQDDLPTLGICRGHQVLNVALGGTLMHDIRHELGVNALHHDEDLKRDAVTHQISLAPQSRLAQIFQSDILGVNSIHHQAVKKLAEPLVEVAVASDGVIEAVEAPHARFFHGVQWHPEAMVERFTQMRLLFKAFVTACE